MKKLWIPDFIIPGFAVAFFCSSLFLSLALALTDCRDKKASVQDTISPSSNLIYHFRIRRTDEAGRPFEFLVNGKMAIEIYRWEDTNKNRRADAEDGSAWVLEGWEWVVVEDDEGEVNLLKEGE